MIMEFIYFGYMIKFNGQILTIRNDIKIEIFLRGINSFKNISIFIMNFIVDKSNNKDIK